MFNWFHCRCWYIADVPSWQSVTFCLLTNDVPAIGGTYTFASKTMCVPFAQSQPRSVSLFDNILIRRRRQQQRRRYTHFCFSQKAKLTETLLLVNSACMGWRVGSWQPRWHEQPSKQCIYFHNALSTALFLITALIKLKAPLFFPFGLWTKCALSCTMMPFNYVLYFEDASAKSERERERRSVCVTVWIDCDFPNAVAMSSRLPFSSSTMNIKIQFSELPQHDNKLPLLVYIIISFCVCRSGAAMMMWHLHWICYLNAAS